MKNSAWMVVVCAVAAASSALAQSTYNNPPSGVSSGLGYDQVALSINAVSSTPHSLIEAGVSSATKLNQSSSGGAVARAYGRLGMVLVGGRVARQRGDGWSRTDWQPSVGIMRDGYGWSWRAVYDLPDSSQYKSEAVSVAAEVGQGRVRFSPHAEVVRFDRDRIGYQVSFGALWKIL